MRQSNRIEGFVAVAMMAVLACGCAPGEPPSLSAAEASRATALFQEQGCPVCHGELAEGVEQAGPALRELAPYWNVERLNAYLEDPTAFRQANPDFDERRDVEFMLEMPAYDALSKEQRDLLAGWLMTR